MKVEMSQEQAQHIEAARMLWQLHRSLRPIAQRVRLTQVTLALSILLYGSLSTEDERLALGAVVAHVGSQEEGIN